jgi:hypothetical protein
MAEPAPSALALARLRALGPQPRPLGAYGTWREAAERGGRRLVDVSRPGVSSRVALGWIEGAEPVAGPDTGVDRIAVTPMVGLTFAAALRACWPDRSDHPFPGVLTSEARILAAVGTLGPLSRGAVEASDGSVRHQKGALRRLAEARYLELDGLFVRLGPEVALWSDAQVSALRASYDQLPTVRWVEPCRTTAKPAEPAEPSNPQPGESGSEAVENSSADVGEDGASW